jgi:predicted enzyme related to lactoylglutathione lyase
MANLVVHFEIHASEPQKLIDFYSDLLGWTFQNYGDATSRTGSSIRGRGRSATPQVSPASASMAA